MALRTNIRGHYLLRLTLVGVACLGFGLYCLYDGMVAWPNQRERALAFQELEEQGRLEEWTEYAAERGWEPYDPGEPKTEAAIQGQFYMLALAGGAGLLVLLHVLRCRGRWIDMDDTGLLSSRGQRVNFDQVTVLDKKKWDKKGIAKLRYEENGGKKTFVLDDFIYDRPTTDEILRLVEEQIGHDKIVNGKPEPPPKPKEAPAEPVA